MYITVLLYNDGPLLCDFNVPIKGSSTRDQVLSTAAISSRERSLTVELNELLVDQ